MTPPSLGRRPPTAEKRGGPRRRNEEGRRETSFSVPSPLFLHHRMGEEIHREWRRGGRGRTDQTDELSSSSEGKTRVEKGERGKQKNKADSWKGIENREKKSV